MPLGLFEKAGITEEKLVLRDGDGILLYTDGITEAINADQEQFGKDRLRETVLHEYREDIHSYEPKVLADAVASSVLAYTGEAEQFDDITCLAAVYKNSEAGSETLTPGFESFATVKETIFQDLGDSDQTKKSFLPVKRYLPILSTIRGPIRSFSAEDAPGIYIWSASAITERRLIPWRPGRRRSHSRSWLLEEWVLSAHAKKQGIWFTAGLMAGMCFLWNLMSYNVCIKPTDWVVKSGG